MSAEALRPLVEREVRDQPIGLRVERTRSQEAAILVAIVGASGAALGALITGILRVAVQKGAQQIVIYGRSGRKIEAPAHTSREQLDDLVRIARELDVDRIVLESHGIDSVA
jgi:hypothetical protein